tara:strand:+ start:1339 stop:1572 length:234 start_codon:yes stop_codon:yes gene_type:complete
MVNKSEILQELEENYKEMYKLIHKQEFKIKDALTFLNRYLNVARKMEDLEKSRDLWKNKCMKLEEEKKSGRRVKRRG